MCTEATIMVIPKKDFAKNQVTLISDVTEFAAQRVQVRMIEAIRRMGRGDLSHIPTDRRYAQVMRISGTNENGYSLSSVIVLCPNDPNIENMTQIVLEVLARHALLEA